MNFFGTSHHWRYTSGLRMVTCVSKGIKCVVLCTDGLTSFLCSMYSVQLYIYIYIVYWLMTKFPYNHHIKFVWLEPIWNTIHFLLLKIDVTTNDRVVYATRLLPVWQKTSRVLTVISVSFCWSWASRRSTSDTFSFSSACTSAMPSAVFSAFVNPSVASRQPANNSWRWTAKGWL